MSLSGDRIRDLRQRNQLTLDDVARHVGVGRQAIYKYEQGTVTNIPLDNLEKMAKLFGTTPGYLAGWTDSETQDAQAPDSDPPASEDIRLLIRGLSKLSPEQVEQAKNVMKAMFVQYADYFESEKENDQ